MRMGAGVVCTSASCVARRMNCLCPFSVSVMDVRSMCRYLGNRHTNRDVATEFLPRTNHILEFSATHATRASTQCHLTAHWLRVSYLSLNSLTSLLVSFLSNESEPSAYVPNKLRILGTATGWACTPPGMSWSSHLPRDSNPTLAEGYLSCFTERLLLRMMHFRILNHKMSIITGRIADTSRNEGL